MASLHPADFLLPLADGSALPLSHEIDGWAGGFFSEKIARPLTGDLWRLTSGFAHHA
jgi:hypothetical protein